MTETLQVEIINEKPPIYDSIIAAGLIFNANSVIFAYNGAIYNPNAFDLPNHIIAHEMIHLSQQGDTEESSIKWWDRYIIDSYFRIAQELEAYAAQYAYMCIEVKDRNQRHKMLMGLATLLGGPMYGNMMNTQDAMKAIKKTSHVR